MGRVNKKSNRQRQSACMLSSHHNLFLSTSTNLRGLIPSSGGFTRRENLKEMEGVRSSSTDRRARPVNAIEWVSRGRLLELYKKERGPAPACNAATSVSQSNPSSPALLIIMFLAFFDAASQRGGNLSTAPTTWAAMDVRFAVDVDAVAVVLSPTAAQRTWVLGFTTLLTTPLFCTPLSATCLWRVPTLIKSAPRATVVVGAMFFYLRKHTRLYTLSPLCIGVNFARSLCFRVMVPAAKKGWCCSGETDDDVLGLLCDGFHAVFFYTDPFYVDDALVQLCLAGVFISPDDSVG